MFDLAMPVASTGKMEARKEVRMHRHDEERIRAAAAATGLQESDFIRQAALRSADEVEMRISLSILPSVLFAAFKAAVEQPGKTIPGLAAAAKMTEGRLKDA